MNLLYTMELIKAFEQDYISKQRMNIDENFVKTNFISSLLDAEASIQVNILNFDGSISNILKEVREEQYPTEKKQEVKSFNISYSSTCDTGTKEESSLFDPSFDVSKSEIKLTNAMKAKTSKNLNKQLGNLAKGSPALKDLRKFDFENCFGCKLDFKDIGFELPSLEWGLQFSELLKKIKAAIKKLKDDLDPGKAYANICLLIDAISKAGICPSTLPQIASILPSLYIKYSSDMLNIKIDWLTFFGPIIKFAVSSIVSLIENIPKFTKPVIDCLVKTMQSIRKLWNWYATFINDISQVAYNFSESIYTIGKTLADLKKDLFEEEAQEEQDQTSRKEIDELVKNIIDNDIFYLSYIFKDKKSEQKITNKVYFESIRKQLEKLSPANTNSNNGSTVISLIINDENNLRVSVFDNNTKGTQYIDFIYKPIPKPIKEQPIVPLSKIEKPNQNIKAPNKLANAMNKPSEAISKGIVDNIIDIYNDKLVPRSDVLLKKYGLEYRADFVPNQNLYDFFVKNINETTNSVTAGLDSIILLLNDTQSYIQTYVGNVVNALKAINTAVNKKLDNVIQINGKILQLVHSIRLVLLIYKLISKGIKDCKSLKENTVKANDIVKEIEPDLNFESMSEVEKNKEYLDKIKNNINLDKFKNVDIRDYLLIMSKDNMSGTLINQKDCDTVASKIRLDNDEVQDQLFEVLQNEYLSRRI